MCDHVTLDILASMPDTEPMTTQRYIAEPHIPSGFHVRDTQFAEYNFGSTGTVFRAPIVSVCTTSAVAERIAAQRNAEHRAWAEVRAAQERVS